MIKSFLKNVIGVTCVLGLLRVGGRLLLKIMLIALLLFGFKNFIEKQWVDMTLTNRIASEAKRIRANENLSMEKKAAELIGETFEITADEMGKWLEVVPKEENK